VALFIDSPFKMSQGGEEGYVSVPGGINHQIYYYLNSLQHTREPNAKLCKLAKAFYGGL
jgi:hypothetical protein